MSNFIGQALEEEDECKKTIDRIIRALNTKKKGLVFSTANCEIPDRNVPYRYSLNLSRRSSFALIIGLFDWIPFGLWQNLPSTGVMP